MPCLRSSHIVSSPWLAANEPVVGRALQAQIDATDRQIDQLVYDLYGLTEEEIRIVEGETTP